MNGDQFKDPLCYLCLVGNVVTLWSLTQEAAVSNIPFRHFWSLNSANSVRTFRENSTESLLRDSGSIVKEIGKKL